MLLWLRHHFRVNLFWHPIVMTPSEIFSAYNVVHCLYPDGKSSEKAVDDVNNDLVTE